MIKLTKGDKPTILETHQVRWTKDLVNKMANGERSIAAEQKYYRHPDIKKALLVETHDKCAYCENEILHTDYGDIEHVIPKSRKPELTFEWDNLIIACAKCNINKADHEGLIDPYGVEPCEHFIVSGTFLFGSPTSETGRMSERVLDLNRVELLERRKERLEKLNLLAVALNEARDPNLRNSIRMQLANYETGPEREFTAVSRCFVKVLLRCVDAAAPASVTERHERSQATDR